MGGKVCTYSFCLVHKGFCRWNSTFFLKAVFTKMSETHVILGNSGFL